jgi:hypothetical protein
MDCGAVRIFHACLLEALSQLSCSFGGVRQSENLGSRYRSGGDKVSDPGNDGAGLSRPWAGDDCDWS